jgi:hypothetical protein
MYYGIFWNSRWWMGFLKWKHVIPIERKGGTSSMKVSWQVTGIRKDPWANTQGSS